MGLIDELVESARARAQKLPERVLEARRARPSFSEALRGKQTLDVIAEYKQTSPSLGDIAERRLSEQVRRYEQAGAAAVSVLTEPTRFSGSYDDLSEAVDAVGLPVLMKDFVVDPAQVKEAAFRGASAVLLIVRCLSSRELAELASAARELGLTPLVECHDASEVELALDIEDAVIGVNNRDLDTLAIDRGLAPRLLADVPRDRVVVAESGYLSPDDVRDVRGVADAVLIGSALMKLDNPAQLIGDIHQEVLS
jgi:indole-3-glycerol phosphate synthase